MKDIKVIHELDESLNQRIIFIKNNGEENSLIDIVTSENKKESYYHALYFKEYLKDHYLEDEELQRIVPKINPLDSLIISNIIYYIINKYQEVIFMETTQDYSSERYGVLTLPDEINESQYEKIMSLKDYFKKFQSIMIQGKLINDGVMVTDSEIKEIIEGQESEKLQEILILLMKKEEKYL